MIIKNSNVRKMIFDSRYKILAIIIAIILVLMGIQLLNYMAKMNIQKGNENRANNLQNKEEDTTPIIQGGQISTEQKEKNTKLIDEFVEYCNLGNIEKAYDLLTEECKELFYPSLEQFKKLYWEPNFKTNKDYKLESWTNSRRQYTYKIKLYEDIMSTGNVSQSHIEDYFTIIEESQKLNINSYIGREEINKEQVGTDIKMTVINKDVYSDYEIYRIKVKNTTGKTILLDSLTKPKTMYIKGSNDIICSAYSHEINDNQVQIPNGYEKELTIKYNKVYTSSSKSSALYFTDIILDYDEYRTYIDKSLYTNKGKIIFYL